MAENICVIPFKDKKYPFNPRDITVNRLRQFKQQYGDDYGRYATFVNLFLAGDADAIACAISIVLKKVDKVDRPPDAIDFSPYDIFEAIREANEAKAAEDMASEDEDDQEPGPTDTGDHAEAIDAGTLT